MSELYSSINIIIPYFGSFPNYFQLFLNSCKYNETINWTIITDNITNYDYPSNVKKVEKSFDEVYEMIQKKFDFEISLMSPHKLCEYKPAYGYVFSEYIKGYDYWGYGDLDLIYGDIRKYIETKQLLKYNKIGVLGHLTIIKNDDYYNTLFMKAINGRTIYREAFSSSQNYNFDESYRDNGNINSIFQSYGEKVFDLDDDIADIETKSMFFRLSRKDGKEKIQRGFFVWDEGKLSRYLINANFVEKKEYIYIHLQKRKMKVLADARALKYKIIPNAFELLENDDYSTDVNAFKKIRWWRLNLHYFKLRAKNLRTKIQVALGRTM